MANEGCRRSLDDLAHSPESIVAEPPELLFGLSRAEYRRFQSIALRGRYELLRETVPALAKLIGGSNGVRLESPEDAAPLLFQR